MGAALSELSHRAAPAGRPTEKSRPVEKSVSRRKRTKASLQEHEQRMKHMAEEIRHLREQLEAVQQSNGPLTPPSMDSPPSKEPFAPAASALSSDFSRQMYLFSHSIGKMQQTLLLSDLRQMLRQWRLSTVQEERCRLSSSIRHMYVRQQSLLISDMAGFTRVTKEEGICHFLMLIKQMQSICLPIMHSFGGTLVKTEADNLFVTFPTPVPALMAALHCQLAAKRFNVGKRRNDQIHLSISVAHGAMFLIPGMDVFGGIVPAAFELGEDVAAHDETLVLKQVMRSVQRSGESGVKFTPAADFDDSDSGRKLQVFSADLVDPDNTKPRCAAFTSPVVHSEVNALEPSEFAALMEQRMLRPDDAQRIDGELQDMFTEQLAVLVIDLHAKLDKEGGKDEIVDADLELLDNVFALKDAAASIVADHYGEVVASMQCRTVPVVFALLPNAAAAFRAAIDFATICQTGEHGEAAPTCGISTGNVLNLGHRNAFGDAVNVAFKLGEDVGEPWEILLSAEVVSSLAADKRYVSLLDWPLEKTSVQVSGVTLEYSRMSWMSEACQARATAPKLDQERSSGTLDLRRRRATPESSQAVFAVNVPLEIFRFRGNLQRITEQRRVASERDVGASFTEGRDTSTSTIHDDPRGTSRGDGGGGGGNASAARQKKPSTVLEHIDIGADALSSPGGTPVVTPVASMGSEYTPAAAATAADPTAAAAAAPTSGGEGLSASEVVVGAAAEGVGGGEDVVGPLTPREEVVHHLLGSGSSTPKGMSTYPEVARCDTNAASTEASGGSSKVGVI